MQWLANPLMLLPLLLLHSRPSESPEDRPKAASSELRPKCQRAPAACSPVGSRYRRASTLPLPLFQTGSTVRVSLLCACAPVIAPRAISRASGRRRKVRIGPVQTVTDNGSSRWGGNSILGCL